MNLQTKVCFKTFISNHLLKVCNIVCALLYLLHTCIERLKTILQKDIFKSAYLIRTLRS